MAKKTIGSAPFPPVVVLDKDAPLTQDDLRDVTLRRSDGLSLCVRYEEHEAGHEKRGGYFFHIRPPSADSLLYSLFDFEEKPLVELELDALVRFINHCSGRKFDQDSFELCAKKLNFPQDD